jgi:hypothetical protein
MRTRSSESRQNRPPQVLVLRESSVKSNDFKIGRLRKSREVSIGPCVRGEQRTLGQQPPGEFDVFRFVRKCDSYVGKQHIIHTPRISHGYCFKREDLSIGCQSKKPLLSQSAEATGLIASGLHPGLCRGMMFVRFKSQCEPEIDIRKMHLLRPESPKSSHSSDGRCLGSTTEPAETLFSFDFWQPESMGKYDRSRSPQPLRATTLSHPARPRHYVHAREYSYRDDIAVSHRNQELIHCNGDAQ